MSITLSTPTPNAQPDDSDRHAADERRSVPLPQIMTKGMEVLVRAGIADADVDLELLIGHVLHASRGEVQARTIVGSRVAADEADRIHELVARRAAREPLQHITGVAYFRHLELAVGPGVFVPRPETEGVVQVAIDALRASGDAPLAVDLGTGSGAIAISLATEVPQASVVAVEASAEAFIWAKRNARGVENLRLVFDDLAHAVGDLDGAVDVVVSNPPYIPLGAIPRDPEVRLHDPEMALYSGADGMDAMRQVSRSGLRLLRSGGTLVVEHGELQGADVRALLTDDGWTDAETRPDLTGRDRTTLARRP